VAVVAAVVAVHVVVIVVTVVVAVVMAVVVAVAVAVSVVVALLLLSLADVDDISAADRVTCMQLLITASAKRYDCSIGY
jgi:hypothetical protein